MVYSVLELSQSSLYLSPYKLLTIPQLVNKIVIVINDNNILNFFI